MNSTELSPVNAPTMSLHQLLGNLLNNFQQVAVKRKSFFINDVPHDIVICADKNIVASVLSNLLKIVSRQADNSCIRVSARAYRDVILMLVKDNNGSNKYSLDANFLPVQPLVGKIGGFIDITNQREKATTIAFSFSNREEKAA